jgi:hypothetical protein
MKHTLLEQTSLYFVALVFCCLSTTLHSAEEDNAAVPLTWQEHQRLATKLFDEGNIEAALSHFEKADMETDQPQLFHYNRGLCHRLLGEEEQALKQFRDAMGSTDPLLDMDAQFQVGQVYFQKAITPSTDKGEVTLDIPYLTESSFAFKNVMDIGRRHEQLLDAPHNDLLKKAETNVKLIAAKYKDHLDRQSREKGNKTPIIQGDVKVNGRAVAQTRVYIKSKWDDKILAHVNCDEGGGFKLSDLKTGKYQLAAALYDTNNVDDLQWGNDIKVPTHEKDVQNLTVQGAITLASPYQTSCPSLEAPWDDHLRAAGAASIVSSTDWGELCDGYPESSLPKDSDVNMAYVAFGEPQVQLVIAVPSQQQPGEQAGPHGAGATQGGMAPGTPNGGQSEAPAEDTPPPTFTVTIKGYHDGEQVFAPEKINISGIKEGLEAPIPLYEATIQTTEAGLFNWKSEEFAHQDCRNLIISMTRPPQGQRMSLHEVEVSENLNQKKDQNEDQKNQDQKQDQDQQQQDQQQDQQEKQEPQESRSTRAVLQKIRDKNKDAKEKQQASGVIYQTDKDY